MIIDYRDRILDLFFGTRAKPVLNERGCEGTDIKDVPGKIAESVLILRKSAAISNEGVNYAELKKNEFYRNFQQMTTASLCTFDPANLVTHEDKLAFWINLYNLLMIDAVLQYNVQKSVTEVWFGVFSFFRRAAYMIGGYRFSLEDIEHGILRANLGIPFFPGKHFGRDDPRLKYSTRILDARIHFALNCASRSCPPIAYYTSMEINKQLDLAAANFITGDTYIDESGNVLWISRIFKWYMRDFGGKMGVIEMLRHYLLEADPRRKLLKKNGADVIRYSSYDWQLNLLT